MATIPTTFDALFYRYGSPYGIPLPFMRAVAWAESRMNPDDVTGSHVGLFQAGEENLRDWDAAAKKAGYAVPAGSWQARLKDPALNTRVFVRTLRNMMSSFAAGGLASDWTWDDYPALLAMGWNAGWSKKSGVRRVLDFLRARGLPLDFETVAAKAKEAGAAASLSRPDKQAFQRSIVALFRRLEAAPSDPIAPSAADKLRDLATAAKGTAAPFTDWGWAFLLAGLLYLSRSNRG